MKLWHAFLFLLITLPGITHSLKTIFGTTERGINGCIKNLVNSKQKVRDAINNYFHQKEQELLLKIKAKYAIIDSAWNNAHDRADQLVRTDPLYTPGTARHNLNDHPFIKEARELIAAYGMNPAQVYIKENLEIPCAQVLTEIENSWWSGPHLRHIMELNIEALAMHDDAERLLTLKHEIRHLWYADSLYSSIIHEFINYDLLDPLYVEYSKNQEMRADIMAATDSLDDAYELYRWLANCMPDDTDDFVHPIHSERLEAAKHLYAYMSLEKEFLEII